MFDDDTRHDPYTHATTDRKEEKLTDAPADRRDKVVINGNMGSDPCNPADTI